MADSAPRAEDAAVAVANMEVSTLVKYVAELCRLLLDANETVEASLTPFQDVLLRFITDPSEFALFVHRTQTQETESPYFSH